jgi:uncharacterized surface protein with fasciclin (FAS1) repeats
MHGSAANPKFDIVDSARNEGSFNTFLMALQAVDPMVDYLKGAGPFTVFMPTDQAFDALAPGTIQLLSKPENHARLKRIIKSHIVKGLHSSIELRTMLGVLTESGETLPLLSNGSKLSANGATVLGRDIMCTNGIIHAVDSLAVQL